MTDPVNLADALQVIEQLRAELDRVRAFADEAERKVTLGGRPPKVDTSWANLALPAPASASDDSAPPLHRKTRDEVAAPGHEGDSTCPD